MDPNEVPTKGNLIRARNSLALSRQGYELMDKKRNILIRELTQYIEQAKDIQDNIDRTFREAYAALQEANVQMGIETVSNIAESLPVDDGIEVVIRSVMGTEIPVVRHEESRASSSSTGRSTGPAILWIRRRQRSCESRSSRSDSRKLRVQPTGWRPIFRKRRREQMRSATSRFPTMRSW